MISRRHMLRLIVIAGGGLVCGPSPHRRFPVTLAPDGEERRMAPFVPQDRVAHLGWPQFLQQWNDEVLAFLREANWELWGPQLDIVQANTLAFPGASPAEIAQHEQRLGVRLPASYRAFVQLSNGWRSPRTQEGILLWPLGQVDWYTRTEPESARAWQEPPSSALPDEKYFIYGPTQRNLDIRTAHVAHCLALGPEEDGGVYLLNTAVATVPDEYEAWDLSPQYVGAIRFHTFAHLMEFLYWGDINMLQGCQRSP